MNGQEGRSIAEWQRLCRASQVWADQARAQAHSPYWPHLLILALVIAWIAIVTWAAISWL